MSDLERDLDSLAAETALSGVVRVDRAGRLVGSDAGVSFRTVHDPLSEVTHTTISNTSDGAWPITVFLDERLAI